MQLLQSSVQLSPISRVVPSLSRLRAHAVVAILGPAISNLPGCPFSIHALGILFCPYAGGEEGGRKVAKPLCTAVPRFGAHAVVAIFNPAFTFHLCCTILVCAKHFPSRGGQHCSCLLFLQLTSLAADLP